MPYINLESFKATLYDICRPNRFMVSFDFEGVTFDDEDYYFVKSASLPGKTFGEIELNWQGYKYKVAGDPAFNDITITFYHNIPKEGMSLRDKLEAWLELISVDSTNVREIHENYKGTINVEQLDGQGEPFKTYRLQHAHPKEISDIELSMDSTDAVEEFTVTFSYSYFTTD